MKRKLFLSAVSGFAMLTAGAAAQAATQFEMDVSTAIDRGIEWLDNQGYYSNPVTIDCYDGVSQCGGAGGLVLLAILEKRASGDPLDPPQGYDGASATDQARMRKLACYLIDKSNEARGNHETYYIGNQLMGLARYLLTGGPGPGAGNPDCPGDMGVDYPSLIDAIGIMTDALLANTDASGFFYYTTPPNGSTNNQDSSATQFGVAGIASAKAVYSNPAYPDPVRLAAIDAALINSKNGYETWASAVGSNNGACDVIDDFERGHGYRSTPVTSYPPSLQQTASGTWVQILGGSNLNTESVQQYLRWLRNHYRWQDLDNLRNSWNQTYWYFLWSSFKATEFLEQAGIAPAPGNIGPHALGTLDTAAGVDATTGAYGACDVRQLNKDPATVPQPAAFGGALAGVYTGEDEGVYFDYASEIISKQCYDGSAPITGNDGNFACNSAQGDWSDYSRQAYAILVLQRATGGACVDTDGDGVCDEDDNCVNDPNPGQEDGDNQSCPQGGNDCPDGVGNVCDNCPDHYNPQQDPGVCQIARCDVDGDGDIDRGDLRLISRARGQLVPPQDPAYDGNGDGVITPADVKACIPQCTRPRCATQ